jgi:hypothetical protein
MDQIQDDWHKILCSMCIKADVDPIIFGSIITIESAWNAKAIRYEPNFIYLETPQVYSLKNAISIDTERALQRFSYGLCQIMGANARSVGFEDKLMDLLDPMLNLEYGIKFFAKRCGEYVYAQDQAAAWNYGSIKRIAGGYYINQGYVDKFNQVYKAALEVPKTGALSSAPLSI